MEKKILYFENLDGLRFFAFLSVFFFHSFYTDQPAIREDSVYHFFYFLTRFGWLGVNLFFVLSGFLITYLILKEEESLGKFNLLWFYIRRMLRIWPLYYLILAICFFLYPLAAELLLHKTIQLPDAFWFLLHLSNYNYIYHPSDIPTLNILWSVSVEEQFYLLWPAVIYLVRGRARVYAFIIIILISLVFMTVNQDDFHYYHHHLLTCMSDLTLGGLAAYFVLSRRSFVLWLQNLSRVNILTFYIVAVFYFASVIVRWFDNIELITAFFFVGIILEQNYAVNSWFKVSSIPFVTRLGQYTYGLYCYHYLALLVAIQVSKMLHFNTSVAGVLIFENAVGLAISIVAAMLSYHFFEKPFLKLKNRFSYFTKENPTT